MQRLYTPRSGRMDGLLFGTTLALLGLGMIAVYSSSAILGAWRFGGSATFLEKQVIRAALGLIVLIAASRTDYRFWQKAALPAWGASLSLLVLLVVLKKLGGAGLGESDVVNAHNVRGAWRWVHFGFITLQPTEIAKVLTVMSLASILSREEGARSLKTLGAALAVLLVTVGLIVLQPNFSSATALLGVGFLVLLIAGLPWWLLLVAGITAPLGILWALQRHGHHMERLHNYLALLRGEPVDVHAQVWQLWQSLVAIGSGGLFGRGLGHGMQKFLFLPDPHTDFIFSIWGEEMGFFGAVALIFLFLVFFARGFRTAFSAPDPFGFYLAAGLTVQMAVYAAVHVAVTTGFFPTTGLPLPFISFGGSSLVMNLFAVGILLNISRRGRTW